MTATARATGVAVLALALLAAALAGGSRAGAASDPLCLGELPGAQPPVLAAPPLRFGINPGVQTGQLLGPPLPARPDQPASTLAALAQLRPPGRPFVLRLSRLFWSDGESGIERNLTLARRYTTAGFEVELQVRYSPPPGHQGDIAGWVTFVREVIRRFGPIPGVIGMQITNEVNVTFSPDSSDGANTGAQDALIQGILAAHNEARADDFAALRFGFSWAYRSDPASDLGFWQYLAAHGGAQFVGDVDWVGLDAYPGTFFPPAELPGGERDGMINALSTLRCLMAIAGLGPAKPIYVEENGYPTGPGRSDATQVAYLQTMVSTVDRYRGTYGVSDYRWFDLRDADSSSSALGQHYGLLFDDYSPKPAFAAYRALVAMLAGAPLPVVAPAAGAPPRRGPRRCARAPLRPARHHRCHRSRRVPSSAAAARGARHHPRPPGSALRVG